MKCRFPIAEVDQFTIAVLLCEAPSSSNHIGLLLHPARVEDEIQDLTRRTYYVGYAFHSSPEICCYVRLAELGGDLYHLRFRGKTFRAEWRDIYIATGNSARKNEVFTRWASDRSTPTAYQVPRYIIRSLWSLDLQPRSAILSATTDEPLHLVASFSNAGTGVGEVVCLHLGLCGRVAHRPHWAAVVIIHGRMPGLARDRPLGKEGEAWHDCDADHIEMWPGWAREVGDAKRRVRIAFARCPHDPRAHRRVLTRFELAGEVFDALVQRQLNRGDGDLQREARRQDRRRAMNGAEEKENEESDSEDAEGKKPPEHGEDEANVGVAPPNGTGTCPSSNPSPGSPQQPEDIVSQDCSVRRVGGTLRAAKSLVKTLRFTFRQNYSGHSVGSQPEV